MGFATDLKRWFLDDLAREPRGGRGSWLIVGLGTLTVAYGFAGVLVEGLAIGAHFVLLGVALGAMGAAELVPVDRIGLARRLRIASWVVFVLYVAVIAVPPLVRASTEFRLAVVAGLAFLVVFGRLLYAIFEN